MISLREGMRAVASAGLIAGVTTACSGGPAPGTLVAEGDIRNAQLSPFLERTFDELDLIPGMAVAVVHDTAVVLLQGFGVTDVSSMTPVTPHTPFYIASSTKSFMGTAAALLERRGVWDLEDPMSRWLPAAILPAPLAADAVTLRQLLTHTSRIDNDPIVFRTAYSGEHDRATLLALLAESKVRDAGFQYGNIGYVIASLAMDTAAGSNWRDVLADELFEPLGMLRTSAYRSTFDGQVLALPHGVNIGHHAFEIRPYIKRDVNMHAAGGIITTAADLARWLEANLNDGRLDGEQILPAEVVREAQRLHARTDARFHDFVRTGYGLGWYHSTYDGEFVLHHFGNYPGFRAHVSFMPAHRIGVAVLTNESAQGYYVPEFVATAVYDRLLGKPDLEAKYDSVLGFLRADAARVRAAIARDVERRAQRPDSLILPAGAYVGTYTNPQGGTLIVDVSNAGRLRATIGVLTSLMEPIDERSLLRVELIPGSGESIEFFIQGELADSLEYGGLVFRTR
jgi:CubicO group peptidase (beta-lactamase class C family)